MFKINKKIMKQMVYQADRKIELLYKDTYKGYNFYILNLGTQPTAYIEIPKQHEFYQKDYDDIDLDVHGGLTYSEDFLYTSKNTKLDKSWFIGWDYAHFEDYYGYYEEMKKRGLSTPNSFLKLFGVLTPRFFISS